MKTPFHPRNRRFLAGPISPVALVLVMTARSALAQSTWNGGTSTDWNDPLNWSAGVPTGVNAIIQAPTGGNPPYTALISAAVPNVNDLQVARGGGPAILNQTAGSITATSWLDIGTDGGTGTYNLANINAAGGALTGFGLGSGSVSAARIYLGGTGFNDNGGTGNMRINTTGTVTVSNDFYIGKSNGVAATGVLDMDAGTINRTGGWLVIGQASAGNGTFNMSGGTVTGANETVVGLDGGSTGALKISAGTFGVGSQLQIGRNFGSGTVNVTSATAAGGNLTGFAQGTASMTIGNRLYVGGTSNGTGEMGTGVMNINTTGTIAVGNDLALGTGGGTGTVNMDAGTMTTGGWNFIGKDENGSGGTGILKIAGGLLNAGGGRTYVGSGNALGQLTVTGGEYRNTGDWMAVGHNNLANATASTMDISGVGAGAGFVHANLLSIGGSPDNSGKATATVAGNGKLVADGEFWVGNRAGSDGALTVSGGLVQTANWLAVGRDGATGVLTISGTGMVEKTNTNGILELANGGGGTATVNLDGGTLKVNRVGTGGGTSNFNFNGGTLMATVNEGNFLSGLTTTVIKSGGAIINSNGFNVTIGQPLTEDAAAHNLTKQGGGTLTLSNGANSYSGVTKISGGTLSIPFLVDGGAGGAPSPIGQSSNLAANLVFDGGTLQYSGGSGSWDRSFTSTAGNTARIDVSNVAATVTLTATAANPTSGGLTKLGNGTLVLNSAFTAAHAGSVAVNGGIVAADGTFAGGFTVNSGGHLTAQNAFIGGLTVPTLALNNGGAVDVELDAVNLSDLITVSNANGLVLTGVTTLNLYAQSTTNPFGVNGAYPIFNFSGAPLTGLDATHFIIGNSFAGKTYGLNQTTPGVVTLTINDAVVSDWLTDGSGDWTDTVNWPVGVLAGVPNSIGAVANFTTALVTQAATVTVIGNQTVGTLKFDNANFAYTVAPGAGGSITFNNGLGVPSIVQVAGNHTVNTPLILSQATNIKAAVGTTLKLGGAISGSNGLTMSLVADGGGGTVVLTNTAANTYTTTTINGGRLEVGDGGTTGSLSSGAVTMGTGAVLAFNHSDPIAITNAISGAGALEHNGTGTLSYTGAATHSGSTNLNTGSGEFTNSGTINGTSGIEIQNTTKLVAGSVTSSTGNVHVFNGGLLKQEGGALSAGNQLRIGGASSGSMTFTGGTATSAVAYIGHQGGATGTVDMSAGIWTTTNNTYMGDDAGTMGIVNLTATAQWNQNHTNRLNIGQRGTAILTMDDSSKLNEEFAVDTSVRGTNKGNVAVAVEGTSIGTWTLNDTSLARIRALTVGQDTGSFGTVNINDTAQVVASEDFHFGPSGKGIVNINGGSLTTTSGWTLIGENAGGEGTLNLSSGSLLTRELFLGGKGGSGGVGKVNMTGGNLTLTQEFGIGGSNSGQGYFKQTSGIVSNTAGDDDTRIGGHEGNAAAAIGIYSISGGTLGVVTNFQIGGYGTGALNVSGAGAVTATAGWPVVGRFNGSFGVLDVSAGGSFNANNGGNLLIVGEEGTGILNVRGGTVTKTGGNATNSVSIGQGATGVGIVNLLTGGLLTTPNVGTGNAAASSTLNFNGGTLQASANSATFLQGLTNVYVYGAGGTIDTQGNSVTIAQDLLSPAGSSGVTGFPITNPGSGYMVAPIVKISGDGTGATAVATINGAGEVTGIIITNPGVNYTNATATLVGGASTGNALLAPGTDAALDPATIAANSTGNLKKIGTGTLDLNGVQGYGTLTTSGGTTNINGVFSSGTSTVNANATTNFTVSQTLAALNIGTVAVADLGETNFAAGAVAVVPEPGSLGLLAIGALGILARRRRR